MSAKTECLIGIELALAIRRLLQSAGVRVHDRAHNYGFRCPKCGKPVLPNARNVGDMRQGYFRHTKRNPKCEASD